MNYKNFTLMFVFVMFLCTDTLTAQSRNTLVYNEQDVATLRNYLNQPAGDETNGDVLTKSNGKTYNPDDPGTYPVTWAGDENDLRVETIMWLSSEVSSADLILPNLTFLKSAVIMLTPSRKLDVSGCTALESLNCSPNILEVLNVNGCVALSNLKCSDNYIKKLDLSTNLALKVVDCSLNELTSLNTSTNTELLELSCKTNKIGSLDVSNNVKLTKLDCDTNPLGKLDVTKLSTLLSLTCGRCGLSELDLSKNADLNYLNCTANKLTELNLSHNTRLQQLLCAGNQLTVLDLSKNEEITHVACFMNLLTKMDMKKNQKLLELNCFENPITSINVTGCTKLNKIDSHGCPISELDLSTNELLQFLFCYDSKLSELNLSNNAKLNVLSCGNNPMTSNLDLSKNTQLMRILCDSINATALSFDNMPSLREAQVQGNKLTLSTLPYNENCTKYTYAPQVVMEITLIDGDKVDLSTEAVVQDKKTDFTWMVGETELVKGTDYTEPTPGTFVFLKKQTSAYCSMWHELFPDLTLTTNKIDTNPLSIESENSATGLYLYPNPSADGLLTIQCGETMSGIAVYDLTGKCITTLSNLNEESYRLDLSSCEKGTYLLDIQTIKKPYRQKIVLL